MKPHQFTGTQINYYFICPRKLWLFSQNIQLEPHSDYVRRGKILHERSFNRKTKEIQIGRIKVDFIDNGTLHEIKKSKKMEKSHKFQVLYYLKCMKDFGLKLNGQIDYPLLKKTKKVELTNENEKKLLNIMDKIGNILELSKPPKVEKQKICKKCAYYEFCWC